MLVNTCIKAPYSRRSGCRKISCSEKNSSISSTMTPLLQIVNNGLTNTMYPISSVFHNARWGRAALAVIVAAVAAVSLSRLGYSQSSPKPAPVTKGAAAASNGANRKAVNPAGNATAKATVDYERDVHAIFADHCM